jgi:hypothetical protein
MGLRLLMFRQEHTPARSAVLITAEMSVAFPLAGNLALEVVSTVVVASMAVVGAATGKCTYRRVEFVEKISNERNYHAAEYIG